MVTINLGITLTLGGILGYFIRMIVEHSLQIRRMKENIRITEFNKAAALFREAFVKEIFLLRENVVTGHNFHTSIINRNALVTHEKAKILFEPFVPSAELERFNQAWENYKTNDTDYSQGDRTISAIKTQGSQDYLDHINNLLEFAKPKI